MPNVAQLITEHVTLTVDCVDRLYLNAYVPRFQTDSPEWRRQNPYHEPEGETRVIVDPASGRLEGPGRWGSAGYPRLSERGYREAVGRAYALRRGGDSGS